MSFPVTLAALIELQANRNPERVALVGPAEELTYGQLARRARIVEAALRARSAGVGRRVALRIARPVDAAVAFASVVAAGCVAVPLDPRSDAADPGALCAHARCALLVGEPGSVPSLLPVVSWSELVHADPPGREGLASALPAPDDVALIAYTSGSTGRPKGVVLTHAQLLAGASNTVLAHELGPEDRGHCVLPMHHLNAQVVNLLATLMAGASLVLPDRFRASELWSDLARHACTWCALAPTHVAQLLAAHRDPPQASPSLRFVRCSSAPLAPALAQEFEVRHGVPLLEAMGLTEAGSAIFSNPLPPRPRKLGSVGLPFGFDARVVDPSGRALEPGRTGEIQVRGPSVMLGYLDDEPATRAARDGDGWLRTGDLGHVDADGYYWLTARAKDIVNKGGVKLSPRAADEALVAHPSVLEAVAFGIADPILGEELVALVIARPLHAPSERELIDWCSHHVGSFRAPARIRFVKDLPRGSIGKVLRHALPDTWRALSPIAHPVDTLEAEVLERIVRDAWTIVLGIAEVGPDDRFLDLGGDSLRALALAARLHAVTRATVSVGELLGAPTVRAQARCVARALGHLAAGSTSRRDAAAGARLSPTQHRIAFLHQLAPDEPVFNEVRAVGLDGPLDADALGAALRDVVLRHSALRTVLVPQVGGDLAQWGEAATCVHLERVSAEGGDRERALEILAGAARRPFDLTRGPLLRAVLVVLGPERHGLLVAIHHLVCDGTSMAIVWRDLAFAYRARRTGEAPAWTHAPPELSGSMEHHYGTHESVDPAIHEDWQAYTAHLPPRLRLDGRCRPRDTGSRGDLYPFRLGSALRSHLERTARELGTTSFVVLLAGVSVVLWRVTREEDLVFGVPTSERDRPELLGVVGCLVDILVVRVRVDATRSFEALCRDVEQSLSRARRHATLPYAQRLSALAAGRDGAPVQPYSVLVNWRDAEVLAERVAMHRLEVTPWPVHTGTAKHPLSLSFAVLDGELAGTAEHSLEVDRDTVRALVDALDGVVTAYASDARRLVSDAPLAGGPSIPAAPEPESTARAVWLPGRVEDRARSAPDALAIVDGSRRVSYAALAATSAHLARVLHPHLRGEFPRVAVVVSRSAELVVSLVGVLRAGGVYAPVEPDLPTRRIASLLQALAPAAVVTTRELARGSLAGVLLALPTIELDLQGPCARDAEPVRHADRDAPAYVLFTSGSTGRPKGVVVGHRTLSGLLAAHEADRAAGRARTLQYARPGFDVSIQEMGTTLAAGGTLVVTPAGSEADFPEVWRLVESERVERLFVPTVALRELAAVAVASGRFPASLRTIYVAGEPLVITPDILRLMRELPQCALYNHYGPTEAHVVSSYRLPDERAAWPVTPPIGSALPHARLYVLDAAGHVLPPGLSGELCIGGPAVMLGYLEGPSGLESDPLACVPGARRFRTGDHVRWRSDGLLEFIGRLDAQVKIRGHRVEPAEVEAALHEHPRVRGAAVVAHGVGSDARLVAWVAAQEPRPSSSELQRHLQERLPAAMVPARYGFLQEMPTTRSGKLDRLALSRLAVPTEASAPTTRACSETERRVADVWCRALSLERVGPDDDFFDVGGHSLVAVRVAAELSAATNRDVPIRMVFERSRLAELASAIDALPLRTVLGPTPLSVRRSGVGAPLSYAQERIWRDDRDDTGSIVFRRWHVGAGFQPDVAQRAVSEIVARHEILRTRVGVRRLPFPFSLVGRARGLAPEQYPTPAKDCASTCVVHSGRSPAPFAVGVDGRPEWQWHLRRAFDLEREVPFRAALVGEADGSWTVAIAVHHLAFDGDSLHLFVAELRELYTAFRAGRPSPLGPVPIQYGDYATWQRSWLRPGHGRYDELVRRARAAFQSPPPPLVLPFGPGPSSPGSTNTLKVTIAPALALRVVDLARSARATPFAAYLSVFYAALHRRTRQLDLAVGTVASTRDHPGLEQLLGNCTNHLVLRARLDGDPRLGELVGRARDAHLAARELLDLPYELLREALGPEVGAHVDMRATFALVRTTTHLGLPDAADLPRPRQPPRPRREWGFSTHLRERPDGSITVRAGVDALRYDVRELRGFFEDYLALLNLATTRPQLRLSQLPPR